MRFVLDFHLVSFLRNHLSVPSSPDSCAQRWRTNRRCTVEANRSRTLLGLLLSVPVQQCCWGSLKTDHVLISGRNHEGSWIFRPQLDHVWAGWLRHIYRPPRQDTHIITFYRKRRRAPQFNGIQSTWVQMDVQGETHPESIQEVLS